MVSVKTSKTHHVLTLGSGYISYASNMDAVFLEPCMILTIVAVKLDPGQ